MNFGIKGKTALVAASSKGIGKAVALAFAEEGCNVVICSRTKNDLINTANEIKNKTGNEPLWIVCDVSRIDDIETIYKAASKQFGTVDILVNNSGGPIAGYFMELSEKDWADAFGLLLMGTIRLTKLVLPGMISRRWGRIINITSLSVVQPVDALMLSNSLRAGVTGFAKTLSNEVAKYNITVNNVAPGYTLTNRLYDLAVKQAKEKGKSHEEILVDMAKEVPMNRLGKPEEIASTVAYLASASAGYLTGSTIHVDGGVVKGLL